jgi:hypothetical protein
MLRRACPLLTLDQALQAFLERIKLGRDSTEAAEDVGLLDGSGEPHWVPRFRVVRCR